MRLMLDEPPLSPSSYSEDGHNVSSYGIYLSIRRQIGNMKICQSRRRERAWILGDISQLLEQHERVFVK